MKVLSQASRTKLSAILATVGIKLNEEAAQKVTFAAEGKLKDGTVIGTTADDWGAGADIYVVDADGNQTPAPAGEHVHEDGRIIVVEPAGMIAEIREADVEEDMNEEVEKALTSMAEQLAAANTRVAALEAEIAAQKTSLSAVQTELASANAELGELKGKPAAISVTASAARPATPAIAAPEKPYSQMTRIERMAFNRDKTFVKQSNN